MSRCSSTRLRSRQLRHAVSRPDHVASGDRYERSGRWLSKLAPWPLRVMIRLLFLNKMLRHEPSNVRIKSPKSLAPPEHCEDDAGIEQLRAAIERFRNHEGEYHPHVPLERSPVTSGSINSFGTASIT